MSGLDFLDNMVSFQQVQILSGFFAVGSIIISTIFTLISLVATIVKFKDQGNFSRVVTIAFVIALTFFDVFIIMYAYIGRYSKQSWQNDDNYTYFGTVNNNKPHGWGKLFDEKENIYYVGEFSDGMPDGKGKFYKETGETDERGQKIMFVWKEGSFLHGKGDGHIVLREYVNGKILKTYDGEMVNDKRCGHGISYKYWKDKSYVVYTGGWYNDQKCGYGIETCYDECGKKYKRYTGTFWYDQYYGYYTLEYISKSDDRFIRVGLDEHDSKEDEKDQDEKKTKDSYYADYLYAEKSLWGYWDGTKYTENPNLSAQKKQEIMKKYPMPEQTIWD